MEDHRRPQRPGIGQRGLAQGEMRPPERIAVIPRVSLGSDREGSCHRWAPWGRIPAGHGSPPRPACRPDLPRRRSPRGRPSEVLPGQHRRGRQPQDEPEGPAGRRPRVGHRQRCRESGTGLAPIDRKAAAADPSPGATATGAGGRSPTTSGASRGWSAAGIADRPEERTREVDLPPRLERRIAGSAPVPGPGEDHAEEVPLGRDQPALDQRREAADGPLAEHPGDRPADLTRRPALVVGVVPEVAERDRAGQVRGPRPVDRRLPARAACSAGRSARPNACSSSGLVGPSGG